MADIKSRMASVRGKYRQADVIEILGWDDALKQAAAYFGHNDCETLAIIMAHVLFGRPGRGRQVKEWTEIRLIELGEACLRLKKETGFKDRRIAELLSKTGQFGKDVEAIRQRLPEAKRLYVEDVREWWIPVE